MASESSTWKRIFSLCEQGGLLSAQEALDLEKQVQESPAGLDARAKLTGYYQQQWMSNVSSLRDGFSGVNSESLRMPEAYFRHALYFIEHVPESEYVRMCTHSIHQKLNPKGYEDARRLWMRHIESDGNNARVLWNAAKHFFLIEEPNVAEDLLLRGKQLEPENPDWPDALSHFYSLSRRRREREEAPARALAEKETALELKGAAVECSELGEAARLAFTAEDFDKAQSYANRAIELASGQYRSPALHVGHTVLGRLAMRDDDVAKAAEHLLASGDVGPYPTLSSFGPTMVLAKELLEAGEREVVLAYFQRCATFWDYGQKELEAWTEQVRAGRIPDFGPSVRQ